MKNINIFILEKLKINSNTKINNTNIISPENFDDTCEHIGIDYNGEEVLVLGKPFKDRNDKNWEITMDYIHNNEYLIIHGFDSIDNKEDYEYYVYVSNDEMEVSCYPYDKNGVLVYEK